MSWCWGVRSWYFFGLGIRFPFFPLKYFMFRSIFNIAAGIARVPAIFFSMFAFCSITFREFAELVISLVYVCKSNNSYDGAKMTAVIFDDLPFFLFKISFFTDKRERIWDEGTNQEEIGGLSCHFSIHRPSYIFKNGIANPGLFLPDYKSGRAGEYLAGGLI